MKTLENPFLDPNALPNICVSGHCLQTAAPGSHYCQACSKRGKSAELELSDDIIIYAIQTESGPINIGATTSIERRLTDLQAGNHEELRVLGHCLARPNLAKDLLAILGSDKIRGKWFTRSAMVSQVVLHMKDGTKALQKYITMKALA